MALDTARDEPILVDERMSWWGALFDPKALVTIGVWMFVNRFGSRYQATDRRVYRRFGIISRNTNTIDFEDVRDIGVRQGILGRILSYGTVTVSTAGTGGVEIDFKKVKNPVGVQNRLQDINRGDT